MAILNDMFKSQEERQKEALEQHFTMAMQHLADKFFNQAMIEFQKAMEIDYEQVYPRLMLELDNAVRGGEVEAAMAIGLNVLKKDPENYELANKLGNFAREMGQFNQAANLYKMALKANKNYQKAFYNLAACSAKVELFDEAAKNSIDQFNDVRSYIFPDYAGPPDFMEQLFQRLLEKKQGDKEAVMQIEREELDRKRDLGETALAMEIEARMKKMKETAVELDPQDVYDALDKAMEERPQEINNLLYNKGIYALKCKDPKTADECLSQLQAKDWDYLELLRAIQMDYAGDLEAGIGHITRLLGENEYNRLYNVNLGLMFRKQGKTFLSVKYLIKTAFLLEKSGGLYSMKELLKQADNLAETGKTKKALAFYQIAVTELASAELWCKIGDLEMELKKYDEAVEAYRKMFQFDPESKKAQENIEKIHHYYAEKGEALMRDRKFKASIEYYEKALTILRPIDTLKNAAGVYKELNQNEKADKLLDEIIQIRAAEKAKQDEIDRQNLLEQGRTFLKEKNYLKAIERYESAFRMKVDKAVFMQLAAIYKGLKKRAELDGLVARWGKMLEHEEKMQKLRKDLVRQQTSD